jgi:hypothetical protein
MDTNIWMIISWVLVFVTGILFLAFILFYTLSGRYGNEVVKAKLSGKKIVWIIDNHNDVRPYAVGGESGNKIRKMGTFIPDPENSIKTEGVKGSLYDSNVAPAVSFNLLTAVKKLSKSNVKTGSINKGGMDRAILEQAETSEMAANELQNELVNDFGIDASTSFKAHFDEKVKEFCSLANEIDNSDYDSELKEFIKAEIKSKFLEIKEFESSAEYQEILKKSMISVVNEYSAQIGELADGLKDEIRLDDAEIKALRNYFALVQPQYVERKVSEGINERLDGQKDLTKVFIYVCGGVAVIILAVAFFMMLVGGNDPTIIVQNASDVVANNATQLPL